MKKKEFIIILIKQFIKFGIVGVFNTLISLIVYYILIYLNINYIIANTAGFLCSIVNAFYWNSKYVFIDDNKKRNKYKSFIKVFISYGLTFVLSNFLLYLWIDIISISKVLAPILNLCITVPLNFILNKLWAMR